MKLKVSLSTYTDSHPENTKLQFSPRSATIISKHGLETVDLSSSSLYTQKLHSDVALQSLPQKQKDKLRLFYERQVERQLLMLKEQYEEEYGGDGANGTTPNGALHLEKDFLSASPRSPNRMSPDSQNSSSALYFTATSPQKLPEHLSDWESQKLEQIEQQKHEMLQRILKEEAKRREFMESHERLLQQNDKNRLKRQRERQSRVQKFREVKLNENRQRRSEAQQMFVLQQEETESNLVERLKNNEKRRTLINREKELTLQMNQEKNEEKLQQIREQHAQVQEEIRQRSEKERQRVEEAAKKHELQIKALQDSLKAQNEQKSEEIQRQVEEARQRKQKYKEEQINFANGRMEKAEENQKHLKKQLDQQLQERKREFDLRESQRLEKLKRHNEEEKQRLGNLMRRHDRQHEDYLQRKAEREQRLRERHLELALEAERRKNEAEKKRRSEQFQLEQRMRQTESKIQKLGQQNRKRLQIALLNKKLASQSASEMERIRNYVASLKDGSSIVPPEWIDVEQLRQLIQQQGLNIQIQKKAPLTETQPIDESIYERLMGNFFRKETREVKMAFGRPFSPPIQQNDGTQILRDSWAKEDAPLRENQHHNASAVVGSTTARSSYSPTKTRRQKGIGVHETGGMFPRVVSRRKKSKEKTAGVRSSTSMSRTLSPVKQRTSKDRNSGRSTSVSPQRMSEGAKAYDDVLNPIPVPKSTAASVQPSPYAQDLSKLLGTKKRTRKAASPAPPVKDSELQSDAGSIENKKQEPNMLADEESASATPLTNGDATAEFATSDPIDNDENIDGDELW